MKGRWLVRLPMNPDGPVEWNIPDYGKASQKVFGLFMADVFRYLQTLPNDVASKLQVGYVPSTERKQTGYKPSGHA